MTYSSETYILGGGLHNPQTLFCFIYRFMNTICAHNEKWIEPTDILILLVRVVIVHLNNSHIYDFCVIILHWSSFWKLFEANSFEINIYVRFGRGQFGSLLPSQYVA